MRVSGLKQLYFAITNSVGESQMRLGGFDSFLVCDICSWLWSHQQAHLSCAVLMADIWLRSGQSVSLHLNAHGVLMHQLV